MEVGRKKRLELEGDKRTKMGRIKDLERVIKDLYLKYRGAKADLMNKIHDLEYVKKENQQAMENQLKEFDKQVQEKERISQDKAAVEERLWQKEQALEGAEIRLQELEVQLKDETKTEAEKEAVREELERLIKLRDEAQEEVVQKQRELGLTRREKILRYLKRAGLTLGVAGAIASIVSLNMNVLNNTGAAVKKLGTAVKNLGKQIASAMPGLLGSVLSLILRTGGELLKFLGNNIWILVVALGAVILKSLTERRRRKR